MSSKVARGLCVAVLVFLAGTAAAYSADLGGGSSKVYSSSRGLGTRHHLGFWGENFPYGYRWSRVRACERRELVDTPRGPRLQTVWVCRNPRRVVFR